MAAPEALLSDLTDAQRIAVEATSGPVAIAAGAGTGKTRVVVHRTAYAIATEVATASRVLLVTFTEKAAGEMAERIAVLGQPAVAARTFHSAALAQLRYFWPSWQPDRPMPEVLGDKWRIVAPLARRLPGGYRFTPTKDLIDEIEWARSRRLTPETWSPEGSREPPIPGDLFVRLFRDYERAKRRQGVIDFDDILSLTIELLESDAAAVERVRQRYAWFTVDEFQDTTPLQVRLLELWLGDRRDLCVVGDEDQTIYSFAGATPEHLRSFERRYEGARVIPLLENHRSTPQVLELANRLLAGAGRSKRLSATKPPGPEPSISTYADDDAEVAAIVDAIRGQLAAGVAADAIAVLVRLNAQLAAFEAALTRAGISHHVRGQRFFQRRDVRAAVDELRRMPAAAGGTGAGADLVAAVVDRWERRLGFVAGETVEGREARERQAALETLLAIVRDLAAEHDLGGLLAALDARISEEGAAADDGVELLTYHRAKGLEWEAVFLPALEEGLLPVAQAADGPEAVAEERRLLYVGITRARTHLALSWARSREAANGRSGSRRPSRFLIDLGLSAPAVVSGAARRGRSSAPAPVDLDADGERLFSSLKAWRTEIARRDGVPAYVVASDATLAGIASARPSTTDAMLGVSGIGPAKVERYGEDILRLVDDDDGSAG